MGRVEDMLADKPFVAFIATKDETKARHFYEEVLGLRLGVRRAVGDRL